MSNRPTGIDAPGMRDTLTVQDADTRKEKVVRLSDVLRHFDSLADIAPGTVGPVWLADGSQRIGDGVITHPVIGPVTSISKISIRAVNNLNVNNPFLLGAIHVSGGLL